MYARERIRMRAGALVRLTTAAALVVLCLGADVARAQSGKGDYIGRWTVSGDFGYALPNTDEFSDEFSWRFGVGYNPIPLIEIGLELGRFETAISQPELDGLPTHDIASGTVDVVPISLTVRLHIPLAQTMATFNLVAGAGYHFVSYAMADAPRGVFLGGGVGGLPDQAVQDVWGFHAGAGLEYALTAWLSVVCEGRYVVLAPEVSGTANEGHQLGGTLDLNTWLFTGGLKVAF